MSIWVWIGIIAVTLFGLDQLFLWAERRGWIYWRKTKGRKGGVDDAFFGVEASINPRAEHVTQAKQTKKREDRSASDPPSINS